MARPLLRPEVAWPAVVILLVATGMGAAFAVLYFSQSDGGAQVLDAYYTESLSWDSTSARRHALARFGWTVDVAPAEASGPDGLRAVDIRVLDAAGDPVEDLELTVEAFRPHLAAAVDAVRARADDPPGRYAARLSMDEPGLWDLVVSGQRNGEPFMLRVRRELMR